MRRLTTVSAIIAVAGALGGAFPALAQQGAESPESLLAQLDARDWRNRSDAVVRLQLLPAARRPAGYAEKIIALLEREAVSPDPYPSVGEGYGEYEIQVIDAVLDLRDPRSLKGLALLGIQTSRAAQEFVAEQGRAALPHLDVAWQADARSRGSVIETWALMLGSDRGQLSAADQKGILRRLLTAYDSEPLAFTWAASDVPLPEAVPLVEAIQAAASTQIGRRRAETVLLRLKPLRDGLTPATLIARLETWRQALCVQPTGARQGACESLANMLADARRQLATGRTTAARNVLSSLAARVESAFQEGALTDSERRLLADNVRYLIGRL